MKRTLIALTSLIMAIVCLPAYGGNGNDKADIKVMTQNQYLGADLGPVIAATPEEYPFAIANALQAIAVNNAPERARSLAESIADRQPHLVALQEVYSFDCISLVPGFDTCAYFGGAFNDHLTLTLAALDNLGSDYEVAAVLQNLTIPALPVFLPGIEGPAMIVSVIDRDVILARGDVPTSTTAIPCAKPAPASDGCHYQAVATVGTPLGDIVVERGFVAVSANVKGEDYLFVDTHLEVRMLGSSEASTALQPLQASELIGTLAAYLSFFPVPPRVILAGDFNNGPINVPLAPYYLPTAYGQISTAFTDTWTLRPGKPEGFTCCQAADLLNEPSSHDERIDIIFANPSPSKVKANVMDAELSDKTISGLWPADHASLIAELSYD